MHEIKRIIAQERRAVIKFSLLLLTDWRASRAERLRYMGLRAYHRAQLERWRAKL